MDNRTKELIAVGASVTANCKPCLEYHVRKARENDASDQEIMEAIGVAKTVRKGAAGKMDEAVSTVLGDASGAPGCTQGID